LTLNSAISYVGIAFKLLGLGCQSRDIEENFSKVSSVCAKKVL